MSDAPTIPLPPEAGPAVHVVQVLRRAGFVALLNGGCVRDLLLLRPPKDFDVATDAPPPQVRRLFPGARLVGAQFGVVLVRSGEQWIETATFRSDLEYLDGRRPSGVRFGSPEEDAKRRDFTINGMFLDPQDGAVIDYVGGRDDLRSRTLRAIGDAGARFAEDHLRLLRAIRFAARLDFHIEPITWSAIQRHAPSLRRVAAERVVDELVRMLAAPGRDRALQLLLDAGLHEHLWTGEALRAEELVDAMPEIARFPERASAELALARLLQSRNQDQIESICRRLSCSVAQMETIQFLVRNRASLDDPAGVELAELKTLMASAAFADLCIWAEARHATLPDGAARTARLAERVASIAPEAVRPAPLVTGADLLAAGVPTGPRYKQILSALYRRQLNEELRTRDAALAALRDMLAQ